MGTGGFVGVLGGLSLAFIAFIRLFLWQQIKDLRSDVAALQKHVGDLEERYDQQRSLKHQALQDVTKTVMALELVRRLAAQCSCGVLTPVVEIIERMMNELTPYRRHDDHNPFLIGENE